MVITFDQLLKIARGCKKKNHPRLLLIANCMNHYFPLFGIDTIQEQRHFIAQTAHETDSYNALEEYASGIAYEGRKDLGNTKEGDGKKFKGRSLIMTTGRSNYRRLGEKLLQPDKFIKAPELLCTPEWSVWAACIYWDDKNFNSIANLPDTALIPVHKLNRSLSPLEYITWRVNGGFNHLEQRKMFYERAKTVIV